MEYQAVILPSAEGDLEKLPPAIRDMVIRRIDWLALHAEGVVHHYLTSLPDRLRGLCKLRVGDYRVLYWKRDVRGEIQVFRVQHRSIVYRKL